MFTEKLGSSRWDSRICCCVFHENFYDMGQEKLRSGIAIQHLQQDACQGGVAIFEGDEPARGVVDEDGVGGNRLHVVSPIPNVNNLFFKYDNVGNLRQILRLRKRHYLRGAALKVHDRRRTAADVSSPPIPVCIGQVSYRFPIWRRSVSCGNWLRLNRSNKSRLSGSNGAIGAMIL